MFSFAQKWAKTKSASIGKKGTFCPFSGKEKYFSYPNDR